ncbi:MAG: hypothetical protein P4M11_08175 [Candidatus Pacebacteria bacterium]|nr:hypothetical protein [Candidatus Paceibacterota bacterium]
MAREVTLEQEGACEAARFALGFAVMERALCKETSQELRDSLKSALSGEKASPLFACLAWVKEAELERDFANKYVNVFQYTDTAMSRFKDIMDEAALSQIMTETYHKLVEAKDDNPAQCLEAMSRAFHCATVLYSLGEKEETCESCILGESTVLPKPITLLRVLPADRLFVLYRHRYAADVYDKECEEEEEKIVERRMEKQAMKLVLEHNDRVYELCKACGEKPREVLGKELKGMRDKTNSRLKELSQELYDSYSPMVFPTTRGMCYSKCGNVGEYKLKVCGHWICSSCVKSYVLLLSCRRAPVECWKRSIKTPR